jgi:peroxiredoxin Q/BCP
MCARGGRVGAVHLDHQRRYPAPGDVKYGLGFPLLADTDHAVAEAYGVWKEKKNYGRTYMGIERSAFLVGPDGKLEQVWYKISPKDTPLKLIAALGE